ncbi:MAG: EscS/YscS/HrcS family type III secretion system export apparatus protein [Firmicutes bacterium RBG_13_65_8]|nr:MAG: EscS/YscS/HrcS family type III secretion system export apparatus protein [Firmicutes bacterium RBG_13_65_8]
MTQEMVLNLGRQAVWTVLSVSAPVLGLTLAVGLLVSIFQATTQIHEQTLTFAPKIVATLVALLVCGSWMMNQMLDLARRLLGDLSSYAR